MKRLLTLYFIVFLTIEILPVYGQSMLDTMQQIKTIEILKNKTQINQVNDLRLGVAQIESMPKMMGIADPLKAVRFLPGFGNGGDANAGLFYRGLSSSNNGYYYNGVEVHNPSHLFGLFPIFNTAVIKEVAVHHNVVPGQYVGKLSGYIDILSDWEVGDTTILRGDVSLFHLGIGARLERDSTRMLEVYWRNTFMNKTLWPVLAQLLDGQDKMSYDFYDLNVNISQRIGSNSFKFFGYTGSDKASFGLYEGNVDNSMLWGNAVMGLEHQFKLTNKAKIENRLGYSQYKANILFDFLGDDFSLDSRQRNLNINTTLSYHTDQGLLETGFLYTVDRLATKLQESQSNSTDVDNMYDSKQHIVKHFVNAKRYWTDRVHTDLSLNTVWISGVSRELSAYPALSTVYQLNARHAIFGGASVGFQPTQQIAITSIHMPIDYVIHSDKEHAIARIKELSTGYRYNHQQIEFSIDSYYRWLSGLKEFDGNIIELNKQRDMNSGIIEGIGITYGVDLFFKMSRSRNLLTANYSYSRSFRKFDQINQGGWYRYIYDRPHNLSVVNAYKLNERLSLSGSFVFSSGSAYTPTIGFYHFNNTILAEYGAKNSARTTAYHRLDIGLEYLLKKNRYTKQKLGFSIINAYNRSNPIYKYLTYERKYMEDYGAIKMLQKNGMFLPILPSITYSFELL